MATSDSTPPREYRGPVQRDPNYQAIRLRGLAGLIRASDEGLADLLNLDEVGFFLATTFDDIADKIGGE